MGAKERRFEEYLRSQGLKFTPQRRLILEKAFATHSHFEADDLLVAFRRGGNRISRATIYRTLPLLVKSGLIREVLFGENHAHYEHIWGHEHHDHLVCLKCGRIIEFCDRAIENLQDKVCAEHSFEAQSHKFEISGYCSQCR
ncbi:MAG: Fur family transcriptional regulator [bacterium]